MAPCVGVKDLNHPVLTGSYHPHSLILPLEVLVSQPVYIQTGICSAFAVLEEWRVLDQLTKSLDCRGNKLSTNVIQKDS